MAPRPATPKQKIFIGVAVGLIGVYFLLVGLSALPLPSKLNGPIWMVLCIGLVFFLAGIAVIIQGIGHGNDRGELPAGAPEWMRALQYTIVGVMFAAFAMIASWIAFGPGDRSFSGSVPLWGSIGAFIGRAAFGFSAIILWLCTLGFVIAGMRRLLRGRPDSRI
jgi:hypothetical protein